MSLWYNHKRVPKWPRRGRTRIPKEQPTEASRQAPTRQQSTKSLPILQRSCLQSWRRTTTTLEFWKFPKVRSIEYTAELARSCLSCWIHEKRIANLCTSDVLGVSEVAVVWYPWCDETKHTVWLQKLHTTRTHDRSEPRQQAQLLPADTCTYYIACMRSCHQRSSSCLLVIIQWVPDVPERYGGTKWAREQPWARRD